VNLKISLKDAHILVCVNRDEIVCLDEFWEVYEHYCVSKKIVWWADGRLGLPCMLTSPPTGKTLLKVEQMHLQQTHL
jgi:hypothetical protein